MSLPNGFPPFAPMAVPLGFAAQIKVLQHLQNEQAERIAALEHENSQLKLIRDSMERVMGRISALEYRNAHLAARNDKMDGLVDRIHALELRDVDLAPLKNSIDGLTDQIQAPGHDNMHHAVHSDSTEGPLDPIGAFKHRNTHQAAEGNSTEDLINRIKALEQRNVHLTARRREAVDHLRTLRTLNQEAGNAFDIRTRDIQPDDLEGIICVHGIAMMSVLNHHQRVLGQLRSSGQKFAFNIPAAATAPPGQQPGGPDTVQYAYPTGYSKSGYCHAHNMPYKCRACGP